MSVTLESRLVPASYTRALAADVLSGLVARPKSLLPKWFYDERGSALFDEITQLEEYYPTRVERRILLDHACDIAAASRAEMLVELGSGTSEKSRLLLSALRDAGTLGCFVPVDVDASVLREAGEAVAGEYGIDVHAVIGDFERDLAAVPSDGRRLVAFLGSTIGNLEPAPRAAFLAELGSILGPGDAFLLGTDLVKDPARLVAAYDDAGGVTAEFNRNVLAVVNRQLGADFDLDAFDHVALWNSQSEWIEMRLRAIRAQVVTVAELELEVTFAENEEMLTEVSAKFRRQQVEAELGAAGMQMTEWWTDPAGDFGLSLSVPA
ncbi:MAG: L-histidine N(alpha)-methyltransferase [Acidimicrobiales bacterium]